MINPKLRQLAIPKTGGGGGGLIPPKGGSVGFPNPPSGGGVGPSIPQPPRGGVGPYFPQGKPRGRTIIDAEGYDVPLGQGSLWQRIAGILGITAGGGGLAYYLSNREKNRQGQGNFPTSPKPQWRSDYEMENLPSDVEDPTKRIANAWETGGKPESDARLLGGMSPIAREQMAYMNSKGMPTADQMTDYMNRTMNDPEKRARINQSADIQRQNQYNRNNRQPTAQETTMGIDKAYLAAEQALMRGEITPDQMPIRRGTANQSQIDKAVANTMRTGIPLGDQYLQPNRQQQQKIGQAYIDQFSGIYDDVMNGLYGEDGVPAKKARRTQR